MFNCGVRLSGWLFRAYFQHFPIMRGKLWIWNNIVRPYIAWRDVQVTAFTKSGDMLQGSVSDTIQGALFFFGIWEPALTQYMSDSLKPGDVFIDVGANVGVHSMLAAKLVGATGAVHAIEASPTIFNIMTNNFACNGIRNAVPHNIAVSDGPGQVKVFLDRKGNLGGTSIVGAVARSKEKFEMVEAETLPNIVPHADILRARIIKIDVEGAEWPVLQGLAPVLPLLRPDAGIAVELNRSMLRQRGVTMDTFLELFAAQGFQPLRLMDHSAALCLGYMKPQLLPFDPSFEMADLLFQRTSALPTI